MDLIIGGAYQGKLAYAMEHFHLTQEDLAHYDGGFDTSRRCICYLEEAVYAAVAAGEPFVLPNLRPDAVVLCTDVSCGVVPMDKTQRLWRAGPCALWPGRRTPSPGSSAACRCG